MILVHDVDPNCGMNEQTQAHPHPVYEAFNVVIDDYGFEWAILKFIRKTSRHNESELMLFNLPA